MRGTSRPPVLDPLLCSHPPNSPVLSSALRSEGWSQPLGLHWCDSRTGMTEALGLLPCALPGLEQCPPACPSSAGPEQDVWWPLKPLNPVSILALPPLAVQPRVGALPLLPLLSCEVEAGLLTPSQDWGAAAKSRCGKSTPQMARSLSWGLRGRRRTRVCLTLGPLWARQQVPGLSASWFLSLSPHPAFSPAFL